MGSPGVWVPWGHGEPWGTGSTGTRAAVGHGAPGAGCQRGRCRRAAGGRALVHCRMGLSRSAATVLAYAMKEFGWSLERALRHVRHCRPGVLPNPGFMRQLDFYQGILRARWAGRGAGHTPGVGPRLTTPTQAGAAALAATSGAGCVGLEVATPLWGAVGGASVATP